MYLMILAVPYYLFFFKGMKVSAELFSLSFPDVNKKRFRITIIYLNKVNWFLPVFLSFRTGSDEAKPGGSGGFPRPRSRPRRRHPPREELLPETPYVCSSPRQISFTFLVEDAAKTVPLRGDASRLLSPTPARSRRSGRRCSAPTALLLAAASSAQHRPEKPEERNAHEHTHVI